MKLNCVQKNLSAILKSLGHAIGIHPLYFVFVPCLLCFILSIGIAKIEYNRDLAYLFTAEKGKAVHNSKVLESLFPTNTSYNLDVFRVSVQPEGVMVIAIPKKEKNMLTEKIFKELQIIDHIIKNFSMKWENNNITYNMICGMNDKKCLENPVFTLVPRIKKIEEGEYHFKYPLDIDLFTYAYTRHIVNLGGVTVDKDRYVKSVKAIRIMYPFDSTNKSKSEIIKQWEEAIIIRLRKIDFEEISIIVSGMTTLISEVTSFTDALLPLTFYVGITIALFSMLTCMTDSWVKSKPWLGIASCLSAGLAIIAAFGFLFICGLKTTDLNITLPFLVLATETDDTYVLIAAWRRTNPNNSVEERLGEAYSEAAVSITITSLTNFLSFLIGITAPFPAVRIFCIYASACIFFTYFFQITFFGGCMALSGYRERERIHPFIFRKMCYIKEVANKQVNELTNVETDFMMTFFKDKLGSILVLPQAKVTIIIAFIINFIFGIWGMTYLQDGMDVGHILKSKSITRDTILMSLKYFSQYPYPIQVVINEPLNYADPATQKKVEEILTKIESHPHTSESFLTLSWLKYYKDFSNTSIAKFALGGYNLSDKQEFIDGLINVFLRLPPAKQFQHDILFNNNYTEILASRFIIGCKNLGDRKVELQLIQDLQKICDQSPFSVLTHSVFFPLMEHQLLIRSIVLQLAWVIGLLIIVIFFLFIPNLICAVFVAIAIITTICETVGYMALWDVHLDMISVILLILSVGFSINYPTHVSFAFVMAKTKDPNERLVQSLYEVGWPIFQGTASTILGVLVLGFQDAYSFTCFFKIVVLIAVLTAFHALFVLPVILSFIGDTVNSKTQKKKKKKKLYDWFIRYKEQFHQKNEETDDNNGESEALSTSQS